MELIWNDNVSKVVLSYFRVKNQTVSLKLTAVGKVAGFSTIKIRVF